MRIKEIRNKVRKRLAAFLRKYFNVGRTQDNLQIWKVNDKLSSTSEICPELIRHLKKVHPKPWYDDELDALFFTVHDYILSRGIKIKIGPSHYNDNEYRITVGKEYVEMIDKKDILGWMLTLYEWGRYG